ncbi:MAG: ParB N-terminal domain-containing protein [Bacteroidota bacterium]
MAKSKRDLFKTLNTGVLSQDKKIIKTEHIKQEIKILPELKNLIPPLKQEEYELLTESIKKNGCRDALLVWEKGAEYILIDGHNRHEICSKHNLRFSIKLLHFADLDEVKSYMIDNQLSRRNLTTEQASYLRGMKYNREKVEKGKYDRSSHKGQNVPYENVTSERLAEEYKVSEKTIKRDALYAAGLEKIGKLNPTIKQEILAGNVKVKKSAVQHFSRVEGIKKLNDVSDIEAAIVPNLKPNQITSNVNLSSQKIVLLLKKLENAKKGQVKICEDIIKEVEKIKGTFN